MRDEERAPSSVVRAIVRDCEKTEDFEAALRQIELAGPDAVDDLLFLLRAAARKRRRAFWIHMGTVGICFLVLMVEVVTTLRWPAFHRRYAYVWPFLRLGNLTSAFMVFTTLHKPAAQIAGGLTDARAIGPLLQAWSLPDTRKVTEEPLTRLLRTVKHSDYGLLRDEDREQLYQTLRSRNPDLVLAALAALEQVGDYRALPYLALLLSYKSRVAVDARVHEAAKQCMAALTAIAEDEKARQTLLRPAEGGVPDTLLRPVAGSSVGDEDTLLRGSQMS